MSRFSMWATAASLCVFSLCASAATDGVQVPSEITDVTVYGHGAIVTRTVSLPSSEGTFVIGDLPGDLDPASLRVRASGAEVVGVDPLLRYRERADSERVAELRRAVDAARARFQARADDLIVADAGVGYAGELASCSKALMRFELGSGDAAPATWQARADFLRDHDAEMRRAKFSAYEAKDKAALALKAAEAALGASQQKRGAPSYDVVVDLAAPAGAPPVSAMVVEYFVPDAGWTPAYDLRASKLLTEVELVYRASVWQTTGEDWVDVPVLLSTARPELGAKGPTAQVAWVGLRDPNSIEGSVDLRANFEALGYTEDSLSEEEKSKDLGLAWKPAFAGVEDAGLSVRFRLPRRETVESRREVSVLSVGRSMLEMELEHVAVPSLSELVWMRGTAENTSAWDMLPGPASVFVAGEFVGRASMGLVPAGGELELPLGPDRGMSIERSLVDNEAGGAGFLRSRSTDVEGWSIVLANFGGVGARPGGSVRVIVQEVLPKSQDDRLRIDVGSATPAVSKDGRFARDREEKGILTWVLDVPKGSESEIRWTRELAWPKDLRVSGQ